MKYLIFDTETTGLVKSSIVPLLHQPCVIELFAVMIDEQNKEIEKFHQFFYPGFEVTEEITRITRITPNMLRDKQRFFEYADQIKAMVERADGVVAHNLSFDMAMLNIEMQRLDKAIAWPRRKICTVENTQHLKGYRLKLQDLHSELFGEGFAEAHRADVDVGALRRCFFELLAREIV